MGWLWLLDEGGVPYRAPDVMRPENSSDIAWSAEPVRLEENEEVPIRQLASSSKSTFALDSNGSVHVFLHPAVLLVRKAFEVYENQRWYPVVGWHHPLPTDWPRISTAEGQRASFDNESLPSTGWRWEESREVQKNSDCDKEGWQYSQLFSQSTKWKKSAGMVSFVRRRRWRRAMRYVAVAKWIPIPDNGKCFVTMTCGCSTLTNQGCLLFAVGLDGKIYRRNIAIDLPEGDDWTEMHSIISPGGDQEDVVLLACAPNNPFLLAVTWEGKMYSRTELRDSNLGGGTWQPLQTPGGKPVTSVSLGNEALWVTTADGMLYYHEIDVSSAKNSRNFLYVHEQSYRELGKSWTCPTVSPRDQLFVLQNGKVYHREGISSEEKMGKAFVSLIDRSGGERKWISIATGGFDQPKLPSHWTSHSSTFNNNDFSFQNAQWRKTILDSLTSQNEHNWDVFQLHSKDAGLIMTETEEGYSKYSKVRIMYPPNMNYFAGFICLSGRNIVASTGRKRIDLMFEKLLQAQKCCDMCPFKYCLRLLFAKESGSQEIRVALGSEKERDSWHEQLQLIIVRAHIASPRTPVPCACWTIGREGNVRYHPMNELVLDVKQNPHPRSFDQLRSIDLPGHFRKISSGVEGVVWTLTETGHPYVLSPSWKSTEERNQSSWEQTDSVTKTIYEYQRHQIFRGYVSFASEIQGIGSWMDDSGPVAANYSRLPTQEWSWLDDSWRIVSQEEDEGWSYDSEIKGNYQTSMSRARFRRRKLTRKAKFRAQTPWISVEGPVLESVVVQKDPGDRILVFGLTENGDVLLRQGVEKNRPQGYVWKQIITDSPISYLALRAPNELWATTTTGKVWIRKCADQTDMECCDWEEQFSDLPGSVSSMVIQNRAWFILNNQLVMIEISQSGLTVTETHTLCPLAKPNGLCLMPSGFLAVLEGGLVNHHEAWEKRITKQGRKHVKTYECNRKTLSTGYSKSFSFNCK